MLVQSFARPERPSIGRVGIVTTEGTETTRFLVAKFAPNIRRMEPRNIGVIVWNDGKTDYRFVGDGSPIPRHLGIVDKENYRRWISSWKTQLTKSFLEISGGKIVPRSSPDFVQALQTWSRGNYFLSEGGELLDEVSSTELSEATSYLFRELVAGTEAQEAVEAEYERLRKAAHAAIQASGIADRADFRRAEPIWYRPHGLHRTFTVDAVIGPMAKPDGIIQRVTLGDQRTFDSTVFHLDWFKQSRNYSKEQCAALVVRPEGDNDQQSKNRELLSQVVTVILVDDPRVGGRQLADFSANLGIAG